MAAEPLPDAVAAVAAPTDIAARPSRRKPAGSKAGTSAAAASPERTPSGVDAPVDTGALLFDPVWYRTTYADVAEAGVDPVRHYFDDGAREGRDPNPHFSTAAYVGRYEDVAASRMNPFLHYLLYGAREGRTPGR